MRRSCWTVSDSISGQWQCKGLSPVRVQSSPTELMSLQTYWEESGRLKKKSSDKQIFGGAGILSRAFGGRGLRSPPSILIRFFSLAALRSCAPRFLAAFLFFFFLLHAIQYEVYAGREPIKSRFRDGESCQTVLCQNREHWVCSCILHASGLSLCIPPKYSRLCGVESRSYVGRAGASCWSVHTTQRPE